MDSSTILVIAVAALLLLAATMVFATGRRRTSTGRLARETRRADAATQADTEPSTALATNDQNADLDKTARARADESRGSLVASEGGAPVRYTPVDEEEIGLTRRQFFNRGILTGMGLSIGAFGVASLAFLWPSSAGGFGAKIRVGSIADVEAAFENKEPYYNAAAKTYIVAYPPGDVKKAAKVYPPSVVSGMEAGYVAIYQKCVHLGCRVPWCETSQWFECPCHGSKYNRVGEKQGGPAPRGLDRFPLTVSGGGIEVDTGTIVIGPPTGTNTTGQGAEGAACV